MKMTTMTTMGQIAVHVIALFVVLISFLEKSY